MRKTWDQRYGRRSEIASKIGRIRIIAGLSDVVYVNASGERTEDVVVAVALSVGAGRS